jgi:hypothetical protein
MANRPCKLDADLEWIWRTLLPDTPFPACPVPGAQSAEPEKERVGWVERSETHRAGPAVQRE